MKVTTAILSKILTLTPRRIAQLTDQGILHPDAAGKFEVEQAVPGYIRFLKSSKKPDLDTARKDKLERETELLEISLAEKRRELIRSDEIREIVCRGFASMMQVINAAANLEYEDKSKLISALRDAGERVAIATTNPPGGVDSPD